MENNLALWDCWSNFRKKSLIISAPGFETFHWINKWNTQKLSLDIVEYEVAFFKVSYIVFHLKNAIFKRSSVLIVIQCWRHFVHSFKMTPFCKNCCCNNLPHVKRPSDNVALSFTKFRLGCQEICGKFYWVNFDIFQI